MKYIKKVSGDAKKLSERLRIWRDSQGWKQWRAAQVLGVKLNTYRSWEQGKCTPRGLQLDAVLKAIQPT